MSKKHEPKSGDVYLYSFGVGSHKALVIVCSNKDGLQLAWLANTQKDFFFLGDSFTKSVEEELKDSKFLFNLNGKTLEKFILESVRENTDE